MMAAADPLMVHVAVERRLDGRAPRMRGTTHFVMKGVKKDHGPALPLQLPSTHEEWLGKGCPRGVLCGFLSGSHFRETTDRAIPDVVAVLAIGERSSAAFGC